MDAPEILAPAGSIESLEAALRCGADAIYVGGRMFSARQNAANFSIQELESAAKRCHLYNAALHLAVNTILFDDQLDEFADFIRQTAEIGVDAYIVQDIGAARIIKEVVSSPVLHGSTQMTIHTKNGAEFLRENGFSRAVLSRELSFEELQPICQTGIETEVFVHGALCMSVSGQCYLSSLIGQRSANRGVCAQPCRLPFSSCKNSDSCALSLKDLSLVKHMDALKSLGVSSLKIEGRMKRPEYVAAAVTALRAAADGNEPDMESLRAVFSRSGFTDGYFTGKRENMFGVRRKEDVAAAKDILPKLRQLYKSERTVGVISFDAKLSGNQPFELTAEDEMGNKVAVTGDIPQKAINTETDEGVLTKQLSRLGGTVFSLGKITAHADKGLSLSASSINEARRNAVQKLSEKRIKSNTPTYITYSFEKKTNNVKKTVSEIRARIASANLLEAALCADRVIIPADEFLKADITSADKIIIEPPRFIADEEKTFRLLERCRKKGAEHLMCGNLSYIKTRKSLGFILHGDFGLNISNSYSLAYLDELGLSDALLSFEMKFSLIKKLRSTLETGIIAYGSLPAMLVRNCPIKNEVGCKKCGKTLTDRTGKSFSVVCHSDYAEILNSKRLYLADKLKDIGNVNFLELYFTSESPKTIRCLTENYRNGGDTQNDITRGLYYRGVKQ